MTTLRKAAEQALDALEAWRDTAPMWWDMSDTKAVTALREALAEEAEHKGECFVELIRENEDGSADYAFKFPPEALQALTRLGIITAIKAGIEDAKRLNPEEYDER